MRYSPLPISSPSTAVRHHSQARRFRAAVMKARLMSPPGSTGCGPVLGGGEVVVAPEEFWTGHHLSRWTRRAWGLDRSPLYLRHHALQASRQPAMRRPWQLRYTAGGAVGRLWIGDEDSGDVAADECRAHGDPGQLLGRGRSRRDPQHRSGGAHRIRHLGFWPSTTATTTVNVAIWLHVSGAVDDGDPQAGSAVSMMRAAARRMRFATWPRP